MLLAEATDLDGAPLPASLVLHERPRRPARASTSASSSRPPGRRARPGLRPLRRLPDGAADARRAARVPARATSSRRRRATSTRSAARVARSARRRRCATRSRSTSTAGGARAGRDAGRGPQRRARASSPATRARAGRSSRRERPDARRPAARGQGAPRRGPAAALPVRCRCCSSWRRSSLVLLRLHERRDPAPHVQARRASASQKLAALEDHVVQNPFTAIGMVKPGRFRRWHADGVLFCLDYATRHIFNHGNLAGVKTIHFARWVFLDGKRRVFFASNYDGSLESYMDDFIDKVAWGLNLVFSNGVGYPRTSWLVLGGAKDELAFKDYLRTHQVPTRVWYSAYPAADRAQHRQQRAHPGRPAGRATATRRGLAAVAVSSPRAAATSRGWSRAATATCAAAASCCWDRGRGRGARWLGGRRRRVTPRRRRPDRPARQPRVHERRPARGSGSTDGARGLLERVRRRHDARRTARRILGDVGDERARALGVGRAGHAAGRRRCCCSTRATTPSSTALERRADRPRSPPAALRARATGSRRPTSDGYEPFGFRDGISQPLVEGLSKTGPPRADRPRRRVRARLSERVRPLHRPAAARPGRGPGRARCRATPRARQRRPRPQRQLPRAPPARAGRARLLAVRRRGDATRRRHERPATRATRLAAKMVGRWPGGAPLVLAPDADDPTLADANDFAYHALDPRGAALPDRRAHPPLAPARLARPAARARATRGRSTAATASCAAAASTARR